MPTDGNLVLYHADNSRAWESGTFGKGIFLIVQDDGNMCLYKPGRAVWGKREEPVWTTNTRITGSITEKVEPLAVAIEALVSAMMVYEKVGAEYQGLEPARKQLRQALSEAIHGL
jgi:hypothetical protein